MFNRRARGFTLIEMVLAMVVIGVGLAGVLLAFNRSVRSSADPLIRKQMQAVAEEMMEEILLKPYAIAPGTIAGCDRSGADDVRDYQGYNQAICNVDGAAVAGLAGYSVSVAVTSIAWQGVANTLRIVVTVTHGADNLNVVGWRTDYAS